LEKEIASLKAIYGEKEAQLSAALRRLESSYKELSQSKEGDEEELNELRTKVVTLQSTIECQEREAADKEQMWTKRATEEKAALEAAYEQSITELRNQLAANRTQLEKVVDLRNEAEANARAIHSEAAKHEKEARRTGSEVRSLKAQIDRERKVAEAALQAAKTAAEAEYYKRLEEQRSKADAEKRAILTIGIDAFRGLFNPSDSLTERTFKTVVTKANEELSRLTKIDRTIRKLLRAGDQQTTEDAVAQALFRDQISE
jgi:hypothetical protein